MISESAALWHCPDCPPAGPKAMVRDDDGNGIGYCFLCRKIVQGDERVQRQIQIERHYKRLGEL